MRDLINCIRNNISIIGLLSDKTSSSSAISSHKDNNKNNFSFSQLQQDKTNNNSIVSSSSASASASVSASVYSFSSSLAANKQKASIPTKNYNTSTIISPETKNTKSDFQKLQIHSTHSILSEEDNNDNLAFSGLFSGHSRNQYPPVAKSSYSYRLAQLEATISQPSVTGSNSQILHIDENGTNKKTKKTEYQC